MENLKNLPLGGFANFMVSDSGFLYKKLKNRIKPVKTFSDKDGYLVTAIQKDKKRISVKIHRLVAEAFIEMDISGKDINHKDGNKSNNNLSNLEVVTHKINMEHAFKNGLVKNIGSCNMHAKLDELIVLTIKTLIGSGWRNKEISSHYSVAPNTISAIRNGKTWKHV